MKHLLLSLLCYLFFSQFLNAQENKATRYHYLSSEATRAIENGNLTHAHMLLIDAFSLEIPPRFADYINMAKCYSQLQEADSTEKYILLALERDFKARNIIRIHRLWFEELLGEEKWSALPISADAKYKALSLDEESVVHKIESLINLLRQKRTYHQNKTPNLYQDTSTVSYKVFEKEYKVLADSISIVLDSILENAPIKTLSLPIVENQFTSILRQLPYDYTKTRRNKIEQLIGKGFLTPDVLQYVYLEEYFGEQPDILLNEYNPKYDDFYFKYGLGMNNNIKNFRLNGWWRYD